MLGNVKNYETIVYGFNIIIILFPCINRVSFLVNATLFL